jgi:TolB-like protein/DNA-binding winged helix-turn-helix (wHTH) protein/cytochrome c-type biogenesis protein CcmH/NrfG
MLALLVANRGRMLSKEELMRTLWPDSFVEESNLTQQISMVRRALGENAGDARYIVTISGRGYRFAADVTEQNGTTGAESGALAEPAVVSTDEATTAPPRGLTLVKPGATAEPELVETPIPARAGTVRRWGIPAIVLGLCAASVLAFLLRRTSPSNLPRLSQGLPTVAILPFHNLQPDPRNDFLGFSLADAVITKLGYVSALTVRPSSAVEKYRNQIIDIPKVAADLDVNTLLTGNFVRDGDRLRITPQLIDVRSQKILWRETLDLKYDNLLAVQDDVSVKIVQGLALNLSSSEAERLRSAAPVNPLAYEYYLRGIDLYSRNDFPTAIKMLEKSLEIDPKYALTWAHLGKAYQANASFNYGGRNQYRSAQAAYERALALDPDQIEARIFMANLFTDTGRVDESVPILRRALTTNPNHPELHWELGYAYRFGGMLNESATECERARQLDPGVKLNSSAINAYLYRGEYDKFLASLPASSDVAFLIFYRGFAEYYRKNDAAAAAAFDQAYKLDPNLMQAQVGKALSFAIAHQNQSGIDLLRAAEQKIDERDVRDPEAHYKIAQAYVALEDPASALHALQRSIEGGFFAYPYQKADPLLDPLHSSQEFTRLLAQSQARHEAFRQRFF